MERWLDYTLQKEIRHIYPFIQCTLINHIYRYCTLIRLKGQISHYRVQNYDGYQYQGIFVDLQCFQIFEFQPQFSINCPSQLTCQLYRRGLPRHICRCRPCEASRPSRFSGQQVRGDRISIVHKSLARRNSSGVTGRTEFGCEGRGQLKEFVIKKNPFISNFRELTSLL